MRISKITGALMEFSREGLNAVFEVAPIKSVVEHALSFCNEKFINSMIDCKVDVQDDTLEIECQPIQLGHALLNLFNNSFEAIEKMSDRWIRVSVKQKGETIELSVTDSGLGIEKNIRQKIAQPFFTTKEVGAGMGLGLTVADGIIKNHGGSLHLDADSINTRFVICLPVRQVHLLKSIA